MNCKCYCKKYTPRVFELLDESATKANNAQTAVLASYQSFIDAANEYLALMDYLLNQSQADDEMISDLNGLYEQTLSGLYYEINKSSKIADNKEEEYDDTAKKALYVLQRCASYKNC